MEEIFEHIGIVLLIIISVVAQIVKVAKKASLNRETPSDDTEDIPMPAPAHADTIGRKTIDRRSLGDTTTFSTKPEFEYTFTAPTKSKKQKKNKPFSHKPAQSAENTGKTETKRVADTDKPKPAVSADNFDIRQAIIYSEIMTPKFNEE